MKKLDALHLIDSMKMIEHRVKKTAYNKKKTLFFSLFTKRSLWYFMDYLRTNTFSWAVYLLNENVEQWILVKHQNILFHSETKVTARHYLNKRFILTFHCILAPDRYGWVQMCGVWS